MKKGIHPEYREVVFRDTSVNHAFLTRSTVKSDKTIEWEDGTLIRSSKSKSQTFRTRFSPDSKDLWTPPDESRNSINATNEAENKRNRHRVQFF